MEELTKREKAYAMACLIHDGFDKPRVEDIKWQPSIHKFVCFQGLNAVGYSSLKSLAERFDKLSKRNQAKGIKIMRTTIGYYVEIAPNFGDQGGYNTESDINSPMFRTPQEAKKWFRRLSFQTKDNYSITLFFINIIAYDFRKVETL